jgi:hypothetical protein
MDFLSEICAHLEYLSGWGEEEQVLRISKAEEGLVTEEEVVENEWSCLRAIACVAFVCASILVTAAYFKIVLKI